MIGLQTYRPLQQWVPFESSLRHPALGSADCLLGFARADGAGFLTASGSAGGWDGCGPLALDSKSKLRRLNKSTAGGPESYR